jgi:hypothetical protein
MIIGTQVLLAQDMPPTQALRKGTKSKTAI